MHAEHLSTPPHLKMIHTSNRNRIHGTFLILLVAQSITTFIGSFCIHRNNLYHDTVLNNPVRSAIMKEMNIDSRRIQKLKSRIRLPLVKILLLNSYSEESASTLAATISEADRLDSSNSSYTQLMELNLTGTENALEAALTDLQIFALCSKMAKYIVVPTMDIDGNCDHRNNHNQSIAPIVLWRNLIDDTPEIIGYPIAFLAQQMKSMMRQSKEMSMKYPSSTYELLSYAVNGAEIDWDVVLPYLDVYSFETGGGVSGLAYGVVGVADGTKICTTPVRNLRYTIPRNYIETGDGRFYELGRPIFTNSNDDIFQQALTSTTQGQSYSLSGTTNKKWFRDGKETATLMVKNTATSIVNEEKSNNLASLIDPDLLQLFGLTTTILIGTVAMQTLSHHLTVNVFWV